MSTRSDSRPTLCPQMRQDAFRDLCAVYDRFLDPRAEPMPENARLDVITYAQVLDVPVDHASDGGDVWRQVRPVLAMQMGPHADLPRDEGGEPTGKVFLPGSSQRASHEGLAEPLAPLSLLVVEDDPDLSAAIVDVELAGEADGAALAQTLHDRWGHKVLFVSGGPNAHLVGLPMALGFVGKPFSAAGARRTASPRPGVPRR